MTTLPPHPDSRDTGPSDAEPFELDDSSLEFDGDDSVDLEFSDGDEDDASLDEDDFEDGAEASDEDSTSGDEKPASPSTTKRRGGLRLFCFNCNRPEGFFTANKGRWFYSYLTGMTFGINHFIGPFRCRCCGHQRYLRANWLHPKTWFSNR